MYVCLLIFSLLLSLRLDDDISWNYGAVFFPIWLWNAVWMVALTVGIVTFIRKRELRWMVCVRACVRACVCYDLHVIYLYVFYREDEEQRINLKAMILSGILQTIVFLQEILIVVNVESGEHKWSAIFTPAYFFCLLCIGACIWSCWRSRGVEVMIKYTLHMYVHKYIRAVGFQLTDLLYLVTSCFLYNCFLW